MKERTEQDLPEGDVAGSAGCYLRIVNQRSDINLSEIQRAMNLSNDVLHK